MAPFLDRELNPSTLYVLQYAVSFDRNFIVILRK